MIKKLTPKSGFVTWKLTQCILPLNIGPWELLLRKPNKIFVQQIEKAGAAEKESEEAT